MTNKVVKGFSKFTKSQKIDFILEQLNAENKTKELISSFWHSDSLTQKVLDEFSENTITNFPLPFGVVPNFLLNNEIHLVPMVIEESSVVAACANSAKFWGSRGGFSAEVLGLKKVGQVHFTTAISPSVVKEVFENSKELILNDVSPLINKMEKRGGGILSLDLLDKTKDLENYYQLFLEFDTCDAMGANFINSVLERISKKLKNILEAETNTSDSVEIVMSILSNYTPDCLVRASVECPVEELSDPSINLSGEEFAQKMKQAVDIARVDTYRATTHNKGIFNGVDAVILASGNDFRAVEACGHTFACRDGSYKGLTKATINDGVFKMWLDLPLAVGTVGGLTSLHPLSKLALSMMGNPSAENLMKITVAAGLAQNFGALRSLVTTGIQRGHMKMHLMNILNQLNANESERSVVVEYFKKETVSFQKTRKLLDRLRSE
jgi:hydroxymethylglutaryl-CoA reductase